MANFMIVNVWGFWLIQGINQAIQVKKSMKVVVVGTGGMPDLYWGFEKGAQFTALGLAESGSNLCFYGSRHDGSVHLRSDAVALNCLITDYEKDANRSILASGSFFFQDSAAVAQQLISTEAKKIHREQRMDHNEARIRETYNWSNVVDQHVARFDELIAARNF